MAMDMAMDMAMVMVTDTEADTVMVIATKMKRKTYSTDLYQNFIKKINEGDITDEKGYGCVRYKTGSD